MTVANAGVYVAGFSASASRFFQLRQESGFLYRLNLALIFACATGLAAQARLYTPFSPVPFTGQVLAVLLASAMLGKWWAGVSQALYVGIGLLGVPWFAPAAGAGAFSRGGVSAIYGTTAGYLVGFVVAAFVIGWLADRYALRSRRNAVSGMSVLLGIMTLGVVIIYTCGALGVYLVLSQTMSVSLWQLLMLSVVPFIALDLAKAFAAGAVSAAIVPRS